MVYKTAGVVTTLCIAVTGNAQEAISLLQTQAHLNTQRESFLPRGDRPDPSLPEPKKQSSMSGMVNIQNQDTELDFQCKNGKGNWVYLNNVPHGSGSTDGRENDDFSQKTMDIKELVTNAAGELRVNAGSGRTGDERTYTEHGPVKNEKDCFARAKMDAKCQHYIEDLKYADNRAKIYGVWYGGKGVVDINGYYNLPHPTCMCAVITKSEAYAGLPRNSNMNDRRDNGYVKVGSKDEDGMWFCQLEVEDMITEAELKGSKGPKEKKTKEEKEKCKQAKADTKSSRAALKALRAQIKAARADLAAKKEARSELC